MTAPLRRRGPRPLPLHLQLALMRATLAMQAAQMMTEPPSCGASPNWSGGSASLPWPITQAGQREMQRIAAALAVAGHSPEQLRTAVARRLAEQDRALIAGIAAYRRHPFARDLPDPPVLWREGSSRLLDYGGTGAPLLVVPSLVNRSYVLDLLPEHSMLRWLAAQGHRVLLLDWGWPEPAERGFTLTDYVAGRLERALAAMPGGRAVMLGYCMGGLLALAAALRRPERLRGLALLATPWNFHAGDTAPRAQALAALLPGLEPWLQATGTLPVDLIQSLFAGLDPWSLANKFRAFARLPQDTPRARHFVALEDWLNDGVPLAAPVARETLEGWYGRNDPGEGRWRVAGAAVQPGALQVPAFVAIPRGDRIVPPASALALAEALPDVHHEVVAAGHIGMAAGTRAEAALWQPLDAWLRRLPG
ncbi:alpha/beta fold hydrolase [Teichococcus vastitatis]|uniref:Alpha/beta fold hydrolase n=1 Tax=Teichococcus vastitatis TaxID=2307076 RepID=A0ABS9W5D7_9PROT|nr:alpha/beta fold hydrolase [Pseudoroseomonas vastitatis]MCI0754506.1 alpha/beta fold hydrolase [Pseudoroseomonas vastitatis]